MIYLNWERVQLAMELALDLHAGQSRKGRDVPYVSHLFSVAGKILEGGGNEDQFIAGLLHDAVEDQNIQGLEKVKKKVGKIVMGGDSLADDDWLFAVLGNKEEQGYAFTLLNIIVQLFGRKVALYVAQCSDSFAYPKKPWRVRKEEFISRCYFFPAEVKLIVACDKWHNLYTTYHDWRREGEDVWRKFNGGKEGTLWYYREVIQALQQNWEHPVLLELDYYLNSMIEKI